MSSLWSAQKARENGKFFEDTHFSSERDEHTAILARYISHSIMALKPLNPTRKDASIIRSLVIEFNAAWHRWMAESGFVPFGSFGWKLWIKILVENSKVGTHIFTIW